MTRSIWHYARAIAYATTGRVELAEREQEAFRKTRAMVPETSILFNNTSLDILGIAEAMMAGEIDYRKGEYETAFLQLREAVRLDDRLNYDEPWGWMQPARHALGALLLEQGRVAEAEQVYRIDLERHPDNIWALQGLEECLDKQGKSQEATAIRAKFELACERTDVTVNRSCFCRTKGLNDDN
jgi:tetratricopeptide (TPR) repeat protein